MASGLPKRGRHRVMMYRNGTQAMAYWTARPPRQRVPTKAEERRLARIAELTRRYQQHRASDVDDSPQFVSERPWLLSWPIHRESEGAPTDMRRVGCSRMK